jgi:diaminopimelate epimerase
MNLKFSKLSACGNDFVAIDNRNHILSGKESGLIRHLCDRRTCAGADGLLLVEKSDSHDFHMRIFNSDGSEAMMCGNGARACAAFASSIGITGQTLRFSTLAGIQEVSFQGLKSSLGLADFSACKTEHADFDSSDFEKKFTGLKIHGFLRVGVPHFIVESNAGLEGMILKEAAENIRYHACFAPEGTNVMFTETLNESQIYLRAWEKGVEAETWGCGTGAVAACILLGFDLQKQSISVKMRGGILEVYKINEKYYFNGDVAICYKAIAFVDDNLLEL